MVGLRGGVDNITNESLRITISWADLVGSFSQDIPSLFPLPQPWQAHLQPHSKSARSFSNISLLWKKRFPNKSDWITIFDDVSQLLTLDRGFTDEERHLAETTGCWIEPTIMRLLAVRPLLHGSHESNAMEEVCRIGTMLSLAPVWRWIGASPVWTSCLTRNLLAALSSCVGDWGELKPLLVWSVYFAAVEARDPRERSEFVFILARLMDELQVREWDGLMQVVKSVLWVERMFGNGDGSIRDEVLSMLRLHAGAAASVLEEIEF